MGFKHFKSAKFDYNHENVLDAVREASRSRYARNLCYTQKAVTRCDGKPFCLVLADDLARYDRERGHSTMLIAAERAALDKIKAAIVGRGQVLTFDSDRAAVAAWLSDDLNLSLNRAQFFEIERLKEGVS